MRKKLIDELRAEGLSCTKIAITLSMDPGQVWLISAGSATEVAPDDVREAIIEHMERPRRG